MAADQQKIPGDPTPIIAAATAIAQLSHAPRKPRHEHIADEEQVIVETLFQRTDMFIRILILVSLFSLAEISRAQSSGSSPTPRAPSLEQRVADLEAYMN